MGQIDYWYIGTDQPVYIQAWKELPLGRLTQAAGTATAYIEAHGLGEGDVLRIRECEQDEYNGDHTVLTVATDTLTFAVATSTDSPATGDAIECGVYFGSGGTVTATFLPDVGVSTLTGDYQTGSRGLFVVNVPDTATFVSGTEYTIIAVITAASGEKRTEKHTAEARYPGNP